MKSMLNILKKKNIHENAARGVYAGLLERTRQPAFYAVRGVPDTFDGRFDLLLFHLFLVIRRMKEEGAEGAAFGQAVFDAAFADMDQTLREMGIGDMGVPKHMRRMMKAFNGRMQAYDESFDDAAGFKAALRRNLFGAAPQTPLESVEVMAKYARSCAAALAGISLTDIAENRMVLPEIG